MAKWNTVGGISTHCSQNPFYKFIPLAEFFFFFEGGDLDEYEIQLMFHAQLLGFPLFLLAERGVGETHVFPLDVG